MLYVLFLEGKAVGITEETPFTGRPTLKKLHVAYDEAKTTPDYRSFKEVSDLAAELTKLLGKPFISFDNGSGTSHRFGVMKQPRAGDEVSYSFNGDSTPCGRIVRITPSLRIVTSDGSIFYRRKNTSSWLKTGGTWYLVQGVHNERNPHF